MFISALFIIHLAACDVVMNCGGMWSARRTLSLPV